MWLSGYCAFRCNLFPAKRQTRNCYMWSEVSGFCGPLPHRCYGSQGFVAPPPPMLWPMLWVPGVVRPTDKGPAPEQVTHKHQELSHDHLSPPTPTTTTTGGGINCRDHLSTPPPQPQWGEGSVVVPPKPTTTTTTTTMGVRAADSSAMARRGSSGQCERPSEAERQNR